MSGAADRGTGVALIALSASSFGAMAIFAKTAYDAGAEPLSVLFLRFTIATALLAPVLVVRREPIPRDRRLAALIVMGGVIYAVQALSFFTALTLASAGLVALLLYLYPAIVTVLTVVLFHERLTRAKTAALALAIVGTGLTIGRIGGGRVAGVALGILAAFLYSGFIVLGSRATRGVGALASTTVVAASAATTYGVLTLVVRPAFPDEARGWAAILGIAVLGTVVAIMAFLAGMTRLGPADASSLSTLEPVVTVVLAAVVLGEAITALQVGGGALILAAVLILSRAQPEAVEPVPSGTDQH